MSDGLAVPFAPAAGPSGAAEADRFGGGFKAIGPNDRLGLTSHRSLTLAVLTVSNSLSLRRLRRIPRFHLFIRWHPSLFAVTTYTNYRTCSQGGRVDSRATGSS